jgi:hypothetical protein
VALALLPRPGIQDVRRWMSARRCFTGTLRASVGWPLIEQGRSTSFDEAALENEKELSQ